MLKKIVSVLLVLCIGLFAVGFNYYKSLKEAPPPVEDTLTYDFDEDGYVVRMSFGGERVEYFF
jgi:hypothetical protein